MNSAFALAKLLGRLAHGCVGCYDIICDLDGSLLNIILQENPPIVVFLQCMRGIPGLLYIFYIILKQEFALWHTVKRLKIIFFYIILKHRNIVKCKFASLKTIFFYIILKLFSIVPIWAFVWKPYSFTSFSNRARTSMSICGVWKPYSFTSFSNVDYKLDVKYYVWKPYSFTSFSNNGHDLKGIGVRLKTIFFYIILKPVICAECKRVGLKTIFFYIC